jgi:hypothetical protein
MLNSFRALQHTFVDEHQPGRVKHELFAPPAAACVGHVRPLLFGGVQALFF